MSPLEIGDLVIPKRFAEVDLILLNEMAFVESYFREENFVTNCYHLNPTPEFNCEFVSWKMVENVIVLERCSDHKTPN